DAIDPVTGDFVRAQIKAELLAHHASEEAANRMLLPMGRAHNGGNRRSLRPAASTRACFDPGRLSREEPALVFALLVRCLVRTDVCVATEARLREATTLTAGASTSVRSGAGLTLVSVGAPTATSVTPIASRLCLVMRSAMGPASASRRQARS